MSAYDYGHEVPGRTGAGTSVEYAEGDRLVRRQVRTRNGVYDIEWLVEKVWTPPQRDRPWVQLRRLDDNSFAEPRGFRRQYAKHAVDWMVKSGYEVVRGEA